MLRRKYPLSKLPECSIRILENDMWAKILGLKATTYCGNYIYIPKCPFRSETTGKCRLVIFFCEEGKTSCCFWCQK